MSVSVTFLAESRSTRAAGSVLSYDLRFAVQDVQPGDRVACNVFFIWEMLRPLLRGATVVIVPDERGHSSFRRAR
jgi:hypothetical protein